MPNFSGARLSYGTKNALTLKRVQECYNHDPDVDDYHEQDDLNVGKYDLDIEDVTNSSLSCLCLRFTIKSQPNLVRISITKKTINNDVKMMVIFVPVKLVS